MNTSDIKSKRLTALIRLYRNQDEKRLVAMLPEHYEKTNRDNYDPSHIDLCITDVPSWNLYRDELKSIQNRQNPVRVPIMLLVTADDFSQISEDTLKTVDQLLRTPVRKKILRTRLENMHEVRTQSLELNRYRQAMDQANSGIVLTDNGRPDNPIIYTNKTFCDITGYTREEFEGQNCRFLQQEDRNQEGIDQLRESIRVGISCQVTIRNYTKSGRLFWNDLKIAPIRNREGRITHFVGVINDVTSQVEKNRELERLSMVARLTHSGVTITDPDKKIQWVNQAFEQMTGYDREEVLGEIPGDILQGSGTSRESIEFMSEKLSAGEGFNTQVLNYKKNGTPFWSKLEVRPVFDNMGNLQQWIGIKDDVTNEVKAYQREKQARQQFYTALEIAPLPVMIRNEEGAITYINRAWSQQSGYRKNELTTVKEWTDKVIEKDTKDGLEAIDKVFKQDKVHHAGEYPIVTQNSERRIWDLWDANLGTLPGEDQQSAITMAIDVTDLRRTQKQKEIEYKKFNQLFENAPNPIAITDQKGRIQQINNEFERLLGYKGGEVAGQSISRLLTRSEEEHEESRRRLEVVKREKHLVEESILYDHNDNKLNVLAGKILVEEEDQKTSIFHIFTDTTYYSTLIDENAQLLKKERKLRAQAEESRNVFKEMFEEAPSAIALLEGPELRYVYANQAYRDLLPRDTFVGKTARQLFPEVEEQGYFDTLDRVYQTGQSYKAREEPIKIKLEDGTWKKAFRNYVYKPLQDENGKTYGILIDAIEVTDQVRFRRELQQRLEEKTTLLSEIHHRVKNNLAIISGLLEMQKDESDNKHVRKELGDAFSRIQSISLVHEQLYQEAESEAHINLNTYIPRLTSTLQQVHTSTGEGITIEVDADEVWLPLNQAVPTGLLLNELLTNAFKHAFQDEQQGHIQVTVETKDNHLLLRISDNGIGLPEDFSLESGAMGMQIVRTLLKQLNAEMTYESPSGEGTIFTVQKPLETEE